MLRPILNLRLPDPVRTKLQSLGYEYVEDIERMLNSSEKPSARLQAIIDENNIAEKVKTSNSVCKIISATDLWHFEFSNPGISVFHKGLDKLLDGGLPVGRITELCGPPGCGKTQMCLQFCVDVQIPSALGGSGGEALYISTDFGFRIERLRQIVQASVQHFSSLEFPNNYIKKAVMKNFTIESLLNGVNVIRVCELNELLHRIKNLGNFLEANKNIKLLIIDSFSLPLVIEVEDLVLRSKIIAKMLDKLLEFAIKHKFAVVLTNQLSTVIIRNGKTVLKPSLGEAFGHRLHKRLLFDENKIYLTKSINHLQLFTRFEITKDGIR